MIWCEPRVIITINKVVTGRFAPEKTDNITNGYAKIQKIIQKDCRNAENPHCIFRIFAVTTRAPAGDSNGYQLYYYKREDSTLEQDFFVRTASALIPVEVKAQRGTAKSLRTLITSDKYEDIHYGIKFTAGNIGFSDDIYTFPYFCAFLLKRYLAGEQSGKL